MPRRPVKTPITAFETTVSVSVPDSLKSVTAKVKSDVSQGMTIELEAGVPMWSLHDLFASGLIEGVSFTYREAEKAE